MKMQAKVILMMLISLQSFAVLAQHNHGGQGEGENEGLNIKNKAQHGGEIAEAWKYKLEIVITPLQLEEKLVVYVYKSNYKQLELKNASGKIKLNYNDGSVDSLDFTVLPDRFYCNPKDLTKPVNIFFTIVLNKKDFGAVFYFKGLNK